MATFYDGGQTFELPAMDMKLWDKVEAVDAAEPGRPTFKAMHDFVKACLPEEYLEAKLGGKSLDKIDLNKLRICTLAVRSAYNREVQEAQIEIGADDVQRVKEIADSLKSITEAAKVAKDHETRQKFRSAR